MKATIRKFILAVNYTIVVVICLVLVTSPQLPFLERAVFGFGAIFAGMGVRVVARAAAPARRPVVGRARRPAVMAAAAFVSVRRRERPPRR